MLLTLLVNALAPGLARALAPDDAAPWSVVCSAAGNARAGAPADHGGGNGLAHCLYCTMHGDQWALPPTQAAGAPLLALVFGVPLLFLQAPHRLHAWAPAQARAPPLAA